MLLGKYLTYLLLGHSYSGIIYGKMQHSVHKTAGNPDRPHFSLQPDTVIDTVFNYRLKNKLWYPAIERLRINIILVCEKIPVSELLQRQVILGNAELGLQRYLPLTLAQEIAVEASECFKGFANIVRPCLHCEITDGLK